MFNLYYEEIDKLARGLVDRKIPFTLRNLHDGFQIIVNVEDHDKYWDAVCHGFSYGHESGLLEILGSYLTELGGQVIGFLTADEILQMVDLKNNNQKEGGNKKMKKLYTEHFYGGFRIIQED